MPGECRTREVRALAKRIVQTAKNVYLYVTLKVLFPWQYRRYAGKRSLDEKKIVFIEANLPALSDSLRPLYAALKKRGGMSLHVHCLREAFVGKLAYIRSCMRLLRDMADARVVFLCEASRVVSCIEPREGCVIVQTWHGCGAFKKFGLSTGGTRFGGSTREYERYPYYRNFTYITISSPEVAWAYEEAMGLKKGTDQLLPVGISRTDVFFRESFALRAREHLLRVFPQAKGKTCILYAPTFRGSVGKAVSPDALDIPLLKKLLGDAYVLLINHHPVVKHRPAIPDGAEDFAIDITGLLTIEELLPVSDICISDYSSLIFEYALFERPMIFFAYDIEDYQDWRGFYYPFEEMTPGPVVTTTQEIAEEIKRGDGAFDRGRVRAFKEKFMSACDGHATERILRIALEGAGKDGIGDESRQ